jgi:hypothetical protein
VLASEFYEPLKRELRQTSSANELKHAMLIAATKQCEHVAIANIDPSGDAYDGMLVVLDAIKRVAESGKEVNRSNVRDAMQATKLTTLQGEV